MHYFQCNYFFVKYRNNSKLLFIDTDSMSYGIWTEDAYENFLERKKQFDQSGSLKCSWYFDGTENINWKV